MAATGMTDDEEKTVLVGVGEVKPLAESFAEKADDVPMPEATPPHPRHGLIADDAGPAHPGDGITASETGHAHPGDGITAEVLSTRWKSMTKRRYVVGFYGHGKRAGEYACFSNFYNQADEPFTFVVPKELCNVDLSEEERTTSCSFSEKAIMLCKAAVMGDRETYHLIQESRQPGDAKSLGRRVANFDKEEWDRVVCKVAYEVVHRKFSASPRLGRILLATGVHMIAEATRNDSIWGIGINVGDERVQTPCLWHGSNILGWALMEVRGSLAKDLTREASVAEAPDAAASSGAAPPPAKMKKRWGGTKA